MSEVNALQQEIMRFDPHDGESRPYPTHTEQFRKFHGKKAWIFNPWTGSMRDAGDIATDLQGLLISK